MSSIILFACSLLGLYLGIGFLFTVGLNTRLIQKGVKMNLHDKLVFLAVSPIIILWRFCVRVGL